MEKNSHPQAETQLMVVILAAGQGTRMRSQMPKVLHQVADRSMLGHAMAVAEASGGTRLVVVTSPGQDDVRAEAEKLHAGVHIAVQYEQLGTAHAVLAARANIESHEGPVLVLYGDTPLVQRDTLIDVVTRMAEGDEVVVVGFESDDPTGYGRLILDDGGKLQEIVEHADATPVQRAVTLCNSGIVALAAGRAVAILDSIGNDNAKGEYYLTDAVAVARATGGTASVVRADAQDVLGVNSRVQLAEVEDIFQRRKRNAVMESGVTMIAPETVNLSFDTQIEQDVIIEPNVVFGPGVSVARDARIRAFSHIEQAQVGEGATVGPYARLRPGTVLGPRTRVGNFVETKAADIGEGAKINHLSYVGDANVGAGANIGAGTITCNYDGVSKHMTEIGKDAFVGSNSALVAPVRIGDGAYVGSGSVITKNVTAGALAVTRAQQMEKQGWVEKFRTLMTRRKEKSS